MKNQKFRSVTAIALTVILAFAVFIPILRVPTSAEMLNKCYYFSDYEPSQTFYTNEINGTFQDSNLYYYDSDSFEREFVSRYTTGLLDNISNAYVIFEIRRNLAPVAYDPNDSRYSKPFLLHLVDFFDELKDRGCQIMFISSVHHIRMAGYYEDLLANVDVYVDIAIWDRFVLTALYNMWNDSDYVVANTTIFLDECLSQENTHHRSWFTDSYIIPFIRALYREELLSDDLTNAQLLERKNIKIIRYMGEGSYYDDMSGNPVADTSDDTNDLIELIDNNESNERIVALGASMMGFNTLDEWLYDMEEIRHYDEEVNFQAYVYNIDGYDLFEHSYAKVTPSNPDVTDIMSAFIGDYTPALESFNNYRYGISNITYNYIRGSHVNQSKTAWLMDFEFGDSDFPIGWFQIVMDPDEYDFYFG